MYVYVWKFCCVQSISFTRFAEWRNIFLWNEQLVVTLLVTDWLLSSWDMTSPYCDNGQDNETTITRVRDRFLFVYLLVINYAEFVVCLFDHVGFLSRGQRLMMMIFHLFEINGCGREYKLYFSRTLFYFCKSNCKETYVPHLECSL